MRVFNGENKNVKLNVRVDRNSFNAYGQRKMFYFSISMKASHTTYANFRIKKINEFDRLIKENKIISNISIQIYWEKLKYMSQNIDILIQNAFKPEFYGFYGVDQNLIASSDEMCQQLIVDSFVFDTNDNSIGCCLSNPEFMFGHFIDCLWSDSWNLIYSYIC